MLDPYLRMPLIADQAASQAGANATRFTSRFKVPDKHGVFTFKVDYRRPGWSYLSEQVVLSITPPRHDEFPRFIGGASPYYLSALSVTVATLLFMTMWLVQR